jgi:hypothetical protein
MWRVSNGNSDLFPRLRRFDARPFTAHSEHGIKSQSVSPAVAKSDREDRATAIRPACDPAIHQAFVARLAHARAAESQDWDFPADLPAAARSAVLA